MADEMTDALTLQDLFASVGPFDGTPDLDDEELAGDVIAAMRELERAVNAAVRAGIDVEPHFERVAGRLPGVIESPVAMVRMSLPAA